MLVGFFDELASDPAALRRRVLAHLGLDPDPGLSPIEAGYNRKAGGRKSAMPPAIRDVLVRHFADELERSAEVLGGPAKDWPGKYS